MPAPSFSDPDFLTAKADAELLYLVQHHELYHPDLVNVARRELQRRGLSPDPATPPPSPRNAYFPAHEEAAEPSLWQRPGLWVGVLAALLVGGLLYWSNQTAQQAQAAVAAQTAVAPPVLRSVETHLIPAFDSLTRAQVAQEMQVLPAATRTQDTTATRKYRLLAERYWKAENQSTYLLEHVRAATAPDSALPGQAVLVEQEWRRLTKALVYNHGLTPALSERMEVMRRAAHLRIETLQSMSGRFQAGQPVFDTQIAIMHDSATTIREALLNRDKWARRVLRGTSL